MSIHQFCVDIRFMFWLSSIIQKYNSSSNSNSVTHCLSYCCHDKTHDQDNWVCCFQRVSVHDGGAKVCQQKQLNLQAGGREYIAKVTSVLKPRCPLPVKHTSSNTTPPNPFQNVPLTGDQTFRCMGLLGPFSFKHPHSFYEEKQPIPQLSLWIRKISNFSIAYL